MAREERVARRMTSGRIGSSGVAEARDVWAKRMMRKLRQDKIASRGLASREAFGMPKIVEVAKS